MSDPQRRSVLDDPEVRRGIRIGGRFLAGWMIFVGLMSVVVFVVALVIILKVASAF